MRNLTKTSLLLAGLCTAAQMVFVTHASAEESIEYDHTYQTPSYIIEKSPQKPVQNTTQKESLFSYLDKHQTQFKLKGNANSHFRVSKTIKDPKTKQTFFKLTEVYKGIPIYGFEQAVAMKENKQVKSFFGKVHPQIKDVSVTPSISEKKQYIQQGVSSRLPLEKSNILMGNQKANYISIHTTVNMISPTL